MRDDFLDNSLVKSSAEASFAGGGWSSYTSSAYGVSHRRQPLLDNHPLEDMTEAPPAMKPATETLRDKTSPPIESAPQALSASFPPTCTECQPTATLDWESTAEASLPALGAVASDSNPQPVFRPLWVVSPQTPTIGFNLADEAGVATVTFTDATPSWKRWVREGLSIGRDIALALVMALLIGLFVIQPVYVKGTSMLPRLREGERLFVNRFIYNFSKIERGDIVVFYYPKNPQESFIKRVIGLPGDEITLANGELYINGKLVREAYLSKDYTTIVSPPRTWVVEPHHYFVMGDNRDASNDSRNWGLVPEMYIYGKAVYRYWPLSEMGFIGDGDDVLAPLRAPQRAEPQRELPSVE
ncbi:MAG: signal peptidase I [Chloracidobacterium sp.]|nr:signal peptidase I [Chloracidobacterium sp.]MDW8215994.1 signal peptidase I [Acidobacteriota bacterium]